MNEQLSLGSQSRHDCPSHAKDHNVYVRVLHDACVKLGGERFLADFLEASVNLVDDWLRARSRPPDDVFLKCLDLLEED